MNLSQYEAFIKTVELGTLTGAAEELYNGPQKLDH